MCVCSCANRMHAIQCAHSRTHTHTHTQGNEAQEMVSCTRWGDIAILAGFQQPDGEESV